MFRNTRVQMAAFLAIIIGAPLGIAAGLRRGGAIDKLARIVASGGSAIPSFCIAPLLIVVFSLHLKLFPSAGWVSPLASPWGFLTHALLPAFALGLFLMATIVRQLRGSIASAMEEDFVRTLWAKGAKPFDVIWSAVAS